MNQKGQAVDPPKMINPDFHSAMTSGKRRLPILQKETFNVPTRPADTVLSLPGRGVRNRTGIPRALSNQKIAPKPFCMLQRPASQPTPLNVEETVKMASQAVPFSKNSKVIVLNSPSPLDKSTLLSASLHAIFKYGSTAGDLEKSKATPVFDVIQSPSPQEDLRALKNKNAMRYTNATVQPAPVRSLHLRPASFSKSLPHMHASATPKQMASKSRPQQIIPSPSKLKTSPSVHNTSGSKSAPSVNLIALPDNTVSHKDIASSSRPTDGDSKDTQQSTAAWASLPVENKCSTNGATVVYKPNVSVPGTKVMPTFSTGTTGNITNMRASISIPDVSMPIPKAKSIIRTDSIPVTTVTQSTLTTTTNSAANTPNSTATKPNFTTTGPNSTPTKPNFTTTGPNSTATKPNFTTTILKPTATKPTSTDTKPNSTDTKPNLATTILKPTATKPTSTDTVPNTRTTPENTMDSNKSFLTPAERLIAGFMSEPEIGDNRAVILTNRLSSTNIVRSLQKEFPHKCCCRPEARKPVSAYRLVIYDNVLKYLPSIHMLLIGGQELAGYFHQDEYYVSIAEVKQKLHLDFEARMCSYSKRMEMKVKVLARDLRAYIEKWNIVNIRTAQEYMVSAQTLEKNMTTKSGMDKNVYIKRSSQMWCFTCSNRVEQRCSVDVYTDLDAIETNQDSFKSEVVKMENVVESDPQSSTAESVSLPLRSDDEVMLLGDIVINGMSFKAYKLKDITYVSLTEFCNKRVISLGCIEKCWNRLYNHLQRPPSVIERYLCLSDLTGHVWLDINIFHKVCGVDMGKGKGLRDDLCRRIGTGNIAQNYVNNLSGTDDHTKVEQGYISSWKSPAWRPRNGVLDKRMCQQHATKKTSEWMAGQDVSSPHNKMQKVVDKTEQDKLRMDLPKMSEVKVAQSSSPQHEGTQNVLCKNEHDKLLNSVSKRASQFRVSESISPFRNRMPDALDEEKQDQLQADLSKKTPVIKIVAQSSTDHEVTQEVFDTSKQNPLSPKTLRLVLSRSSLHQNNSSDINSTGSKELVENHTRVLRKRKYQWPYSADFVESDKMVKLSRCRFDAMMPFVKGESSPSNIPPPEVVIETKLEQDEYLVEECTRIKSHVTQDSQAVANSSGRACETAWASCNLENPSVKIEPEDKHISAAGETEAGMHAAVKREPGDHVSGVAEYSFEVLGIYHGIDGEQVRIKREPEYNL